MTDDITIDVGMNPADYLAGVDQMTGANSRLQQSMSGVVTTSSGLQRAMAVITPSRATLAGLGALAVAAGNAEQELAGLSATSAITGINTGKLAQGIRGLAREMPMGNTASRQVVEQFTRMGVAAAGSEKQITELSRGVIRLSGATGDAPDGLARGMTQLARATGNMNLDTRRFDALGDSLVRVSKTSGAGASDILAFSKNIAPMAQAAGIGATGILGISGAFARLGEDGVGASTAVNKMLTDMSRSVREGGPQMKTYAEIVGTTADEFERLFKSNPGEALNKVVESVAQSGQGPRQLEMLGLDGVRTQRALQALSASGGLRPAMEQAQAGYGSGDTEKAAQAAFKGLNDSFTELTASSQQLAQVLGAPLTMPLKAFTEALKAPVNLLTDAAASKPGQGLLGAAGIGLTAFLGTKALMGPLSLLGLGRQAAKSGPVRGVLGGIALGAEDELGATRRSRAGAMMIDAYDRGTLGNGLLGGVNTRAFDFGVGMGERLKQIKDADAAALAERNARRRAQIGDDAFEREQARYARRAGMNPFQRAGDTAKTYGMTALNTYIGEMGRQWENASIDDPRRRSDRLATPDQAREAGRRAREVMDNGGSMREAFKEFHDHLVNAGKDAGSFGEMMRASRQAAGSGVRLGNVLGDDATRLGGGLARRSLAYGRAGLGALSDMLGVAGPLGLAVLGGTALYAAGSANAEKQRQQLNDYAASDMYSRLNAYREVSGRAGVPAKAVTAGTAMEVQERSKEVTVTDALRVTPEDIRLAQGSKDKKVTDYYGSTAQIAATIAATYPKGLNPQDLQAVKYDLLRGGRSTQDVQGILDALPPSATRVADLAPAGSNAADIAKMVKGAQKAPGGGWAGFFQGLTLEKTAASRNDALTEFMPDWLDTRPGGGAYISAMSDEGKKANEFIGQSIQTRFDQQSQAYQGQYASQERLKAMNAAIKAATDSGDFEQADYLSRLFQKNLMGKDYETKSIGDEAIAKAGGFAQAFAQADKEGFGKTYGQFTAAGGSLEEGKGIKPVQIPSYYADILKKAGGNAFAASMFDNVTKPTEQTRAIAASIAAPEDAAKLSQAASAFVDAGRQAGMSLEQVGTAALKASNEVSSLSPAFAILRSALETSDRRQAQANVASGATGTTIAIQRREALSNRIAALGEPQDEATKALRNSMIDEQTQIDDGLKQRLVARLETQRQYEKQVYRQTRDFNRQLEYAEIDYQTQVNRTVEGYQVQRSRSIEDFNRQRARAEEDYGIQRARQVRDFNISIQRAEQDAQKARMRAIRDFNISLKRQIEDAAKSMYDPYQRIQVKATWDARNLMVNLQQQNEAMAKQKDQLDQLRKMGLSAQAIDQLQLGKAENAQQVNNLMADFSSNPELIAQLNEIAKARAAAAGDLYTDESNTDLKRAREDLSRSLSDMQKDLSISLKRARADLAKNLKDQADDFARNMRRSEQDFNRSLERAEQDLSRNLGYMEDDQAKSIYRQKRAFNTAMADMRKDVKDADTAISADFKTLNDQVNRAIHGQSVAWNKLIVKDTGTLVNDLNSKVIPDMMKALADIGISKTDLKNASAFANPGNSTMPGSEHTRRADGGPIGGYSPHERADNIRAMLTAGEFVQPVKAVNYYGPGFMEAIRTQRFPRELAAQYAAPAVAPPRRDGEPHFADGGMVWQQMAAWVHKNLPGVAITSAYRSPAANRAAGGSPTSMHMQGKALDLAPSMRTFDKILSTFGPKIWELFYTPANGRTILKGHPWRMPAGLAADHWDHVHWAMQSMSGAAGSYGPLGSAASGAFDEKAAFKGFDPKKAWVYAAIADEFKKVVLAKVSKFDSGGMLKPGAGAYVNETGKPEPVLTDDQWSSISKLAARGVAVSREQAGHMATGCSVVNVTNHITYDHSNDFADAQITVVSQDPNEMGRKIEEKIVTKRVTQTRGVRRNG